ncbi:MAG TPA: LarC family nickel insertion protein, partial [Isosphaeraceae bacterium]|nr:LarC family nickel insertion protein [Isosphaeraceae bacterium]
MRVAHFDCFSGISGDMTLAALIDAGVSEEAIRQGIASLGLPIQMEVEKVRKGGFRATYVRIEAPEETSHRFLPEVEEILQRGSLSERQRTLALRIFRRLAEAEAAVHGMPLERVHFHEVGALDSIADIAGAAIGLDLLGVERFTSRSVPTGSGMVKCAHGLMPIPAPGTAELLKGVPLASSVIKAELTTPTGAAILTTIVEQWTDTPAMTIEQIGHGAGRRDFPEQPNLLR